MARGADVEVGSARRRLVIPAAELEWTFVRSSGPGGQHVNRTSSKAVLRFCVRRSAALPDDVRQRILQREASRITGDGCVVIVSQRHREQGRNVADCLDKLATLVRRALEPPRTRRRTKPPRSAATERLAGKKRRGETKRLRGAPVD